MTNSTGHSKTSVRIMTYNVHSCRGLDFRTDPERIARVIRQQDPDIVALQEVLIGKEGSRRHNQPQVIAEELGYKYHFQSALDNPQDQYGIALLSRLPFEIIRSQELASSPLRPAWLGRLPMFAFLCEPREAIWMRCETQQGGLNVINTHLGLRHHERMEQVNDLLGPGWMGDIASNEDVVLVGDLNAGIDSPELSALKKRFEVVNDSNHGNKNMNTYLSACPSQQLDHICYKGRLRPRSVEVARNRQTVWSSDHLPVVCEFTWSDA